MRPNLWNVLFVGALSLWSCIASAGPLHYEFSTILKLDTGPDTNGLAGASMLFTAEIADGTVFAPDPFFGLQTFIPISHEWTIIGSGSVDGTYSDPNGSSFAVGIGWFGFNGAYFNFAPFSTNTLALYQPTLDNTVNTGDLVGPEHFGPFSFAPYQQEIAKWQTNDGSRYNWVDNARFSVTDPTAVPAPSTLALSSIALGIAVWFSTRRRLPRQSRVELS